jgi:hypothetical protein
MIKRSRRDDVLAALPFPGDIDLPQSVTGRLWTYEHIAELIGVTQHCARMHLDKLDFDDLAFIVGWTEAPFPIAIWARGSGINVRKPTGITRERALQRKREASAVTPINTGQKEDHAMISRGRAITEKTIEEARAGRRQSWFSALGSLPANTEADAA